MSPAFLRFVSSAVAILGGVLVGVFALGVGAGALAERRDWVGFAVVAVAALAVLAVLVVYAIVLRAYLRVAYRVGGSKGIEYALEEAARYDRRPPMRDAEPAAHWTN